jgi:aminoglycoside 6'-N-acetyltransferase I
LFGDGALAIVDAMSGFLVRRAGAEDIPALARLRATLWPEGSMEEHAVELGPQLESASDLTLVAEMERALIGFLEGRLRSHADGCETSPVGYLEGWFVTEEWRGRGVGRALVEAFEVWARERGCRELASDTWLHNTGSQRAHERLGFSEVDRVVTYRKPLDPDIQLGPHARPPVQS